MRAIQIILLLALLWVGQSRIWPAAAEQSGIQTHGPAEDAATVRLVRALEAYRQLSARGGWPQISSAGTIRPGRLDSRVPLLRRRLIVSGDHERYRPDSLYDDDLETSVRRFQRRHGLEVDGIIGPRTFAELNVTVESRIEQIERNLERRRSLPEFLGERYAIINIPAFALEVMENDSPVLAMRVIVGKRSTKTPIFNTRITEVILAPFWNVPESIARNEIRPRLKRDPGYLVRNHIRELDGGSLRQDPGPANPLGAIKFSIPNAFSVGLHDTPEKALFAQTHCAFSHGCMRLQRPLDLAVYLLKGARWNAQNIQETVELWRETRIAVPDPLPLYVVYHTAFVDQSEVIHFPPDVYGYDSMPEVSGRKEHEVAI